MNIIQYPIVNNDSYRANVNKQDSRYTTFQKRGPTGLMLHSVGCSQPSASVFAKQWNRSGYEVSVHAVLQSDGTVYQCMPWNYRAWHCGGSANNTHVGVEMTEPSQIKYTGGSKFTVTDRAAAVAQVQGTYNTAVELFAQLCKTYSLNPMTAIISHKEGHAKGLASDHGDPEHLWKGLGLSYTMDTFRAAVKAKMNGQKYTVGWNQDANGWWYSPDGNTYVKSAWRWITDAWYHFDANGYMEHDTDVQGMDGNMYHLDTSGKAHVIVTQVFEDTEEEVKVEIDEDKEASEVRYNTIGEVTNKFYRPTLDKLVAQGVLKGKRGSGDGLVIDLSEDSVRLLVMLDRAGVFGGASA